MKHRDSLHSTIDTALDMIVVAAPCGHESYAIVETVQEAKTALLSAFEEAMLEVINSCKAYSNPIEYEGKYLQMFEAEEFRMKVSQLLKGDE